jgi:peptidoglycan hydrolase-like amidase
LYAGSSVIAAVTFALAASTSEYVAARVYARTSTSKVSVRPSRLERR